MKRAQRNGAYSVRYGAAAYLRSACRHEAGWLAPHVVFGARARRGFRRPA